MLRQLISSTRSLVSRNFGATTLSLPSLSSLDMTAIREVQPLTTLLSFKKNFTSPSYTQLFPDVSPNNAPSEQTSPAAPWTPTRLLQKRKALPKRMGHMIQLLEKEREEEAVSAKKYPDFRPGDFLELKLSIPENKRRTTVFKGICIAKNNKGWRTTFTLRNFIGTSGGIERSFPL